MNEITVLFFATMRDHTGERKILLDVPENTPVSGLKTLLAERYPHATGALDATLVSINRDYAFDEDIIPAGAEVAMFPHVSGG
ncbi:MAG: MoaD/ThiS family protein [Anaerolineae bacterium]|nr:MoaD/ThiS family protein [Anaerolineae bacterium]